MMPWEELIEEPERLRELYEHDLLPVNEDPWQGVEGDSTGRLRRLTIEAFASHFDLEEAIREGVQIVLASYEFEEDDSGNPQPVLKSALATLSLVFEDRRAAIRPPKLSLSLLSVNASGQPTLAGYGRLDDQAFGTVQPRAESIDDSVRIVWERVAVIRSLDRARPEAKPLSSDIVVYGPGGEILPTLRTDQTS